MNTIINDFKELIEVDENFTKKHVYSLEEIESFEKHHDWKLLGEYKEFLKEVGTLEYKYDEFGGEFKFIDLQDIESWSNNVFPPSENLYPTILLIATSTSGEEYGIIKGESKLYVFNPEVPCHLWLSEKMKEYTFNEWLNVLCTSKMEVTW